MPDTNALLNVSSAQLREVARCLDDFNGRKTRWVIEQDRDGSVFLTAVVEKPPHSLDHIDILWALIDLHGSRHWTMWCDESARRVAARICHLRVSWALGDEEDHPGPRSVEEFDRAEVLA